MTTDDINKTTNKKRSKTGINTWPKDDRPRERLFRQGAHALTDAELLAILLRVGMQGTSAVELSRQILKKTGSLKALSETSLSALLAIKGLKDAKVAQLSAAIEIARRINKPDTRNKVVIKTTLEAKKYIQSRFLALTEEHCRAILLNRLGVVLEDTLLAVGSVDRARPSLRLIVSCVMQTNASAIILAHNHPSGVAVASESDKIFTGDVVSALHPIGVRVLDHIIIGDNNDFSFADSGLLDEIILMSGVTIERKIVRKERV